ncbi:MAG: type III-B CRISPR module RAMP protein Cmr4 [Anaerolineales bacterium]|nr:type III-B CRISPR module RAMP protein Cmr4 [Anaerolineales bacterium]
MYTLQRFILMTLDPVHIGTGGYRLGRVDNSIAREPGTKLPKIPGTSLSGAARSYAAMRYEKPGCAGQGGHCGETTCPICYTFGNTRGQSGSAGTISLADAHLLLFPVYSMTGPVWVTTKTRLVDAGFAVNSPEISREQFITTLPGWDKSLNLGWLMLSHQAGNVTVTFPDKLTLDKWDNLKERLVLVDEGIFSHIVNSNLEVRTSVSIEPETGAAKDGALFTYEALPRASLLWCDIVEDNYRRDPITNVSKFPVTTNKAKAEKRQNNDGGQFVYYDNQGNNLGETWRASLDVVKAGLAWAEYLGIGGMGTRGFGRIKLLGNWEVDHA